MATNNAKLEAILRDYEQALEDLTFNSKPLINDLTMAADKYKPIAARIVEKIEKRIMEVKPEHKLPTLYLMDSIVKNLRGEYLELFSRNIVALFCRSFERLTDPKSRLSLFKLRQTWSQYIPKRKLVAIDKHVHALDPNWPVAAVETSPPSPTIFVNPKFIGADQTTEAVSREPSSMKASTSNAMPKTTTSNEISSSNAISSFNTASSSKEPVVTVTPAEAGGGSGSGEGMSLQDRRKQLLEQQRQKKLEQQKAMGLTPAGTGAPTQPRHPPSTSKLLRTLTPPSSGRTSPVKRRRGEGRRGRSASPLPTSTTSSQRSPRRSSSRTASPVKMVEEQMDTTEKVRPPSQSGNKRELNLADFESSQESTPPAEKRPHIEKEEDDLPSKPITRETLEAVQDLPPELLPKHQEYVLKQVEKQLKSGKLTTTQHGTLVKQVEQFYALQLEKEETKHNQHQTRTERSPPLQSKQQQQKQETQTASQNRNQSMHSRSPPPSSSVHSDRTRPFKESEFASRHGPPPPRPPHPMHPPHDRYPRGGPRPRFRSRGRPPRVRGRGGFYDGPPQEFLGRRPPPHWEPLEVDGPGRGPPLPPLSYPHPHPPHPLHPPPSQAPSQPQVAVSDLFSRLVEVGIIGDGGGGGGKREEAPPLPQKQDSAPPEQPPLRIPNLSFTPATLRQRYSSLVSLLHAGEQCASCGLRFPSRGGAEYRAHLDWHYQVNRRESEGLRKTSRNWFMHPEDWLKYEELEDTEEKEPPTISLEPEVGESSQPKEEELTSCEVLPGEGGNEVCTICQEPFEQFWEEDLEEWHFRDAMRTGDGKLYHTFCYQDAKEAGTLDNSGSQLPSPDTEQKLVTGID